MSQRAMSTPGLRAREDRAAAEEARAADHLPVRLDAGRILADQVVAEVVHGGLDGSRPELHAGLSPAGDPLVGADADERPLRRADECVDGGDLHGGLLLSRSMADGASGLRLDGRRGWGGSSQAG